MTDGNAVTWTDREYGEEFWVPNLNCEIRNLKLINVVNTSALENHFAELSALDQLIITAPRGAKINLSYLSSSKTLRYLYLNTSNTEDLAFIKEMPNLSVLILNSPMRDLQGIHCNANIQHLLINNARELDLGGIGDMKQLRSLKLNGTIRNISELGNCSSLVDLRINDGNVDGEPLPEIQELAEKLPLAWVYYNKRIVFRPVIAVQNN